MHCLQKYDKIKTIKEGDIMENINNFDRNSAVELPYNGDISELPSVIKSLSRSDQNVYITLPTGKKMYVQDYRDNILAEVQDEIYREVYGKSVYEVETMKAKLKEEQERINDKSSSINNLLSEIYEQAKPYIYEEKLPAWSKKIAASQEAGTLKTLVDALAVMRTLDSGDMGLAKSTLKQFATTDENSIKIQKIVALYAKQGPEFFEFMNEQNLSEGDKVELDLLKRHNETYAERENMAAQEKQILR